MKKQKSSQNFESFTDKYHLTITGYLLINKNNIQKRNLKY